jgi:alpha-glucosidase
MEYGTAHAGFTGGEPWLPVDPRHEQLAVNAQEADPESMLNWTRAWLFRRRMLRALREGSLSFLPTVPEAVAFERRHGSEVLWCAFNPSSRPVDVGPAGGGEVLEGGSGVVLDGAKLGLAPWGAALVRG